MANFSLLRNEHRTSSKNMHFKHFDVKSVLTYLLVFISFHNIYVAILRIRGCVATLSNQKDHEFKGNLDRVYRTVLQSGKKGIKAIEIADKLGIDRTTVYSHLRTLDAKELAKSDQGIWHAKTGDQTAKPLEKEIIVKLPLPEKEWQRATLLEAATNLFGDVDGTDIISVALKNFNETRTIRITGKNVDGLDLEKASNLIKQALEQNSRFSLKGLFRGLKKSRIDNPPKK